MPNEDRFVKAALDAWKTNIERNDKAFSSLTPEQLNKEIAPGKNRLIYILGHLTAVHDRMLPLLDLGPRLYPELDEPFLTNPDNANATTPSAEAIKKSWNEINGKLAQAFNGLQPEAWLEKHTSVSTEDFAKNPSRNRLAVLLSRTNHLAYHLGQVVLATK